MAMDTQYRRDERATERTNGAGAAAILAAGFGTFVTGLMTTLAQASGVIKGLLLWSAPVGPLSGKTGVGVIAWLALWAILHITWKDREVAFVSVYRWSLGLVFLGFALMFPPVFEAFGH